MTLTVSFWQGFLAKTWQSYRRTECNVCIYFTAITHAASVGGEESWNSARSILDFEVGAIRFVCGRSFTIVAIVQALK